MSPFFNSNILVYAFLESSRSGSAPSNVARRREASSARRCSTNSPHVARQETLGRPWPEIEAALEVVLALVATSYPLDVRHARRRSWPSPATTASPFTTRIDRRRRAWKPVATPSTARTCSPAGRVATLKIVDPFRDAEPIAPSPSPRWRASGRSRPKFRGCDFANSRAFAARRPSAQMRAPFALAAPALPVTKRSQRSVLPSARRLR